MNSNMLKYAWQFVLLCFLQVLVFNNLQLGGYVNPFPYIYLILVLPVNMSRIQLLFVGFTLGLTIDVFSNTGGIHAAATTLIAFYRPFFLKSQSPREGFELHATPRISAFGAGWFIPYAALLTFIHHSVLFYLEVFRFNEFFHTLLKTLLSFGLTLIFILVAELLTIRKKKR